MNIYTIVAEAGSVAVYDGRVKGAKLKYEADNLMIYVKGAFQLSMRDRVHYHAIELAAAHHIPANRLYNKGWV